MVSKKRSKKDIMGKYWLIMLLIAAVVVEGAVIIALTLGKLNIDSADDPIGKEYAVRDGEIDIGKGPDLSPDIVFSLCDGHPGYELYRECLQGCESRPQSESEMCMISCKDGPLQETALTFRDEDFCIQITDGDLKQSCLNAVISAKAVETRDKALCDRISEQDRKDNCLLPVLIQLAIEKDDIGLCQGLPETLASECRNEAYQGLALNKLDDSYCDELREGLQAQCKNELYRELARQKGDEKYCEKLEGLEKDMCITDVAMLKGLSVTATG